MDEVSWGRASSLVKLCCGIGNNACWYVLMEAMDRVKALPVYRQQVKKAFVNVLDEWKVYERGLLYSQAPRFFHLADMAPEVRRKFGCTTDAEYFEFWQGIGGDAYARSSAFVSSLANKYRLSLVGHGCRWPETVCWVMAGMACLEIAVKMCDCSIKEACGTFGLPVAIGRKLFGCFSLAKVRDAWKRAMFLLDGGIDGVKLSDGERRNIELGIIQLEECWGDPKRMVESTVQASMDYSEIFSSPGMAKKVARELKEGIG